MLELTYSGAAQGSQHYSACTCILDRMQFVCLLTVTYIIEDVGDKMVHSVAAVLPICHWHPSESASAETFDPKHWRVRPWRHVFDHNTIMVSIPLRHILDSLNTPEIMQMRTGMLKPNICLILTTVGQQTLAAMRLRSKRFTNRKSRVDLISCEVIFVKTASRRKTTRPAVRARNANS